MNNTHLDHLSVHDNEFMELLWKNGQIVMQGPSNRARESFIPTFSSQPVKLLEKEGRDSVLPKISQFGETDSVPNDFTAAEVSRQSVSNAQDADIVPWPNQPVDDYLMELLSEFSGSNTSTLPVHSNSVPAYKDGGSGSHVPKDSQSLEHIVSPKPPNGSSDSRSIRNIHNHILQQRPSSVLSTKSRTSDIAPEITTTPVSRNPSTWGLPDAKLQRQDAFSLKLPQPTLPPESTGSPGLVNFSHFTRPVATLKANIQSSDWLRNNEKASTTTTSTTLPVESTLVDTSGTSKGVSQLQFAAISDKVDVKLTHDPEPDLMSVKQSDSPSGKDASRDNKMGTGIFRSLEHVRVKGFSSAANIPASRHALENKNSKPIVASSVCSASGAYTASDSNNAKHREKRKVQEREETGDQSEDGEDESAVVKKPARARGSTNKRGRAAEVHNLSERRRRDRINEKMRSLQELIPNCNKVDKASMLDEAIEYLKTLQLQVQIMSMCGGMYIPPMMLAPGMQPLRSPHTGHFPPITMGVGMGMNMGMGAGHGMGMLDTNGSPIMMPMPPMEGQQFPCSVPGNPGVSGMAGSSGLQAFGIPGQGYPVPMNPTPCVVPPPIYSAARLNTTPEVSGMQVASMNADETSQFVDPKRPAIHSEAGRKVQPDDRCIPISAQATTEPCENSSRVQIKTNASSRSSVDPLSCTSGNGNSSTGASSSLG